MLQDVTIDGWRITSVPVDKQSVMTARRHARRRRRRAAARRQIWRDRLWLMKIRDISSNRIQFFKLVTIRVGQVKETLAPFGISRGCVRPIPRRDYAPIERINVRIVEDHSSPPGPMPLGRLGS